MCSRHEYFDIGKGLEVGGPMLPYFSIIWKYSFFLMSSKIIVIKDYSHDFLCSINLLEDWFNWEIGIIVEFHNFIVNFCTVVIEIYQHCETNCDPKTRNLFRIAFRYKGYTSPTSYCLSAVLVVSYLTTNLVGLIWSKRRLEVWAADRLSGITATAPRLSGITRSAYVIVADAIGNMLRNLFRAYLHLGGAICVESEIEVLNSFICVYNSREQKYIHNFINSGSHVWKK